MKSSSILLKCVVIVGLALGLYASRHAIFGMAAQTLIHHVLEEEVEYTKRVWRDGSLVYEEMAVGDWIQAVELRLTPEVSFFPPHLSLGIYLTQPRIQLSSKVDSFVMPDSKWVSFKLDVEQGVLCIDEEPLGVVHFVSGEGSSLGTLILSEEQGSPYCSCEISHDFSLQVKCERAPVLHLASLMRLFAYTLPFELQGGHLDVEAKGFLSSLQGHATGHDLQIATSYGELDVRSLEIVYGEGVEARIEGGHFTNGEIVIEGAATCTAIDPLQMSMEGTLAVYGFQGPFSCQIEGEACNLRFLEWDIPFSWVQEGPACRATAKVSHVSVLGGAASVQAALFFEGGVFKRAELETGIGGIKIKEVSCDFMQGKATLEEGELVGQLTGVVDVFGVKVPADISGVCHLEEGRVIYQGGATLFSDCVALSGEVDLATKKWSSTFKSPYITLSSYSSLLLEDALEVQGYVDAGGVEAHMVLHGSPTHVKWAYPTFSIHMSQKNTFLEGELGEKGLWKLRWSGPAQQVGEALYDPATGCFPEWTARLGELYLHGCGRLQNGSCLAEASGSWKEITLQGALAWDFKEWQGRDVRLTLEKERLKLVVSADDVHCQEGIFEIPVLQTTAYHPILKEPIGASLTARCVSDGVTVQGSLLAGSYENDWVSVTELHALKVKGHIATNGEGALKLTEGEQDFHITFVNSHIDRMEGKLFGVDCCLRLQEEGYEGRLKLEKGSSILKPEWKPFENFEFVGLMTPQNFKGAVFGQDVVVQGYHLSQLQAQLEYCPTQIDVRQLKIDDPAGQLQIKELHATRAHPQKAWEISIPHLRGQQIQPSLLCKEKEPKPFQLRQLTLTNLKGILGRPLTFQGEGSFYFTQHEKKDPSFFDVPRAFLKEWGLDLALLAPARGSATIELSNGKCMFRSLQDTFSEGDHSQFYLAEGAPSYIDFSGGLFLNLRMKQNVALKLAEPFTLSVRGTWEKPFYTLR